MKRNKSRLGLGHPGVFNTSNMCPRALCLAALALGACSVQQPAEKIHGLSQCPVLIAHRGGGREVGLPDNSLTAIDAGVSDALDSMEVDVRWSSDGRAFLFHDKRLRGDPWGVTQELAGREFSSLTGAQLERICTTEEQRNCLPPLSAVLGVMGDASAGELQLDLKDSPNRRQIEELLSDLGQRNLIGRVAIFCDPISECELVRDISPHIRVMARVHDEGDLKELMPRPPWAVQVDEDMLSHPLLSDLRMRGVLVMVKTLDDASDTPQHWNSLRQQGVDRILTDRPRAARSALCAE
jgi:glycerophosphoryl diester phosphodiesterase